MENYNRGWSVPVKVQDITERGLHLELEAPEAVRAALVKLANLREVMRVAAVFDLSHRGRNVHVAGRVSARVGQTCVVSLEPVESEIAEPVDLLFSADAASLRGREVELSIADGGAPEPLVGGQIDLGAIATEFLLLGIDPYPRKPGVEFSAPKLGNSDAAQPFAALEALKNRLSRSES